MKHSLSEKDEFIAIHMILCYIYLENKNLVAQNFAILKSVYIRITYGIGVFRISFNIYDGALLRK